VVRPSEYAAVIPSIDPEVATLTLATCTPAYTARDRLIILATLVPDTSAQVYRPASTAVPVESTVPPTLPTESVPDTTPTTTSVTATTVAAAVTLDQAAPDTDAFAQGWFEDASAVPQVILWGLALVAVVMFAWYIGRHVNKLWVSVLVGAVPFVVVLYFFFENVNRLLPPSI
jgi:sortase A